MNFPSPTPLEFPLSHKYDNRPKDASTGQYLHTKWSRLCKCGHPIGVHTAEKCEGQQPCIASDFGGPDCNCQMFRRTNNFLSEEEYKSLYMRP